MRRCLSDLARGSLVLVACSGGSDSMALLVATTFVAPRLQLRVGTVVVDHCLQAGSGEVAEATAARATALGATPVEVRQVAVGTAGGPEAAAREARRHALKDAASEHGASIVLLGHTLDDQAETVLLGLARGSGARSLAGMRPVDGLWRRPLLGLRRSDTLAACAAAGERVWQDPHNDQASFTRVRVRLDVLPVMDAALGPGVAPALARTADLLRADADLLDRLAADLHARVRVAGGLSVQGLAEAPPALRTRVLRIAALGAGCPPSELTLGHVRSIEAMLTDWHGQRGVDLPGRVTCRRTGTALGFSGDPVAG